MMRILVGAVTFAASQLLLVGCGDDSSSSDAENQATAGAPGDEMTGGGGQGSSPDRCSVGCVATLAAACSNGPPDQASCESTCRALEAGSCGAEYDAFQDCAEGKDITCGASGIPVVEACSDEQAAFIACLSG